jgi:hypothetical protein
MLKIFNLFKEKPPKPIADPSKGILSWGKKNNLPQEIIQTIYDSPTASACMDTFIDFLEGDGITQEEIAKFKINKTQTFDELHSQVAPDEGYCEGFAIEVKYGPTYEILSLKHLPFESTRLGVPDDYGFVSKIHYNPLYGTCDYRNENDTIIYDVYNPDPETVKAQYEKGKEKYCGQVYYYATEKPLKRFYPEPFYYGGLKWFIIDNKIMTFHERNIDNNFLLSVLMKIIGDPDEAAETDPVTGAVTKTVGQLFNEQMHSELAGAENGGKVFVAWAKVKEAFPELQAFPNSTNHDLFIALQQLVVDNISIATKVPPILANIQVAGKLGNSQEIVNAIKLMYQRVNKKQRILERAYKELLSKFMGAPDVSELSIRNLNPVSIMPPEVWASLTREEQRKFIENNYDIELIPVQPLAPSQNGL